jgi:hypothetical protein
MPAAGFCDGSGCWERSPKAGRAKLKTSASGKTSAVLESDFKNPRRVKDKAGISLGPLPIFLDATGD